jgi:hypothetical protein
MRPNNWPVGNSGGGRAGVGVLDKAVKYWILKTVQESKVGRGSKKCLFFGLMKKRSMKVIGVFRL